MDQNRRFGWMMALILAAWVALHFWRIHSVAFIPLIVAILISVIALVSPDWFEAPRKAWLKFGDILNRINQPIILGIIFFGVITPVGFLRRRFGHSKMDWQTDRENWQLGRTSYWQPQKFSSENYDWKGLRRQF